MSAEDIAKIRSLIEAQYQCFRESQMEQNVPVWIKWGFSGLVALVLALGSLMLNITLEAGEYRERISIYGHRIENFEIETRELHSRFANLERTQAVIATKLDAILDKLDVHEARDRGKKG